MIDLMQYLYWLVFALAAAGSVAAFLPERLLHPSLGSYAALAAFAGLTVVLAIRWSIVGHPAIFGTFENTMAAGWVLLAFALLMLKVPNLKATWRVAFPWVLALLVYGTRFRSEPVPLTISEQSLWVDIHALFAWSAFVPLLTLGTVSALKLVRRGEELKDLAPTQRQIQLIVSAAFIAFTAMLVTGAWYLNVIFGTFWQWGVVETVSLITWLLYAMVLHGILFRRWSPHWLAWTLMLLVPALLVTFFVWSLFPGTFHFFDVPLVRPY